MKGLASLECHLTWHSEDVKHTDVYFLPKFNFWRDIIPAELEMSLEKHGAGHLCSAAFSPGDLFPAYQKSQCIKIRQHQFNQKFIPQTLTQARVGRFYPSGILNAVDGVFKDSRQPVRCLSTDQDFLRFDLNHPLAATSPTLSVLMHEHQADITDQRGGRCIDVADTCADNGPGMQARHQEAPDFFADTPFQRLNPQPDSDFYAQPRMVAHLDDTAADVLQTLYGRLLKPDMQVLDLMSSWTSHLPDSLRLDTLVGLGMNATELEANPRLTEHLLQDLNTHTALPFADHQFDAIICSLSVEYLTQPFDLFDELARVLKPGGLLIHTFSNRWFPSKSIRLWSYLHEFERMGLVLEYFARSGQFSALETYSMRNLARPEDDKYFPQSLTADPIFAVWGQRKG